MAIGDTVQAALGRMNFSAFQRAGEAQARAAEQAGQAVSGVVGTYFDTKKRNKELEGQIKGVSSALKTLARADNEFADLYEAQDARINDPQIPLSQRTAEALSFMQNLGVTEKFRSQRQLEAQRDRELDMRQELNDLRADAMKFQTLKDKYMLGQQIKRDDFFPVEQQVEMEIQERQNKINAQIENHKVAQLNRANAETKLRQLEDNEDLDRATKEVELEKARKDLELADIQLNTARRQFDRISGLDTTIDLSDEVVPDPNNEIFQLLATMDLDTALQGDLGGITMRVLSGGQKFLFGGTLAQATEAEGQKMGTIDFLLREPLLKRISSRPTNLTNEKVDEILPKKEDNPTDGKKKIRESLLPALRSQLETAKRTLLSTAESEKPYIQDAEKLATELPNIIKGLEIALIDDRNERRSAFSAFFEGDTTTQPTVDATNMNTTKTGVRYRVRRTN
jgi:hypothetical protein